MEFQRIFTNRKVLLLFLLLLLAAAGTYLYFQAQSFQPEESWKLFEERQQQSEHISSYSDYLSGIIEESNVLSSISIFQNADTFSSKNLEKTREDYLPLEGVEVSYGQYEGLASVINFELVHYIIFVFSFILVWFFFEDEKKGLWCVSYAAPKGRAMLAVRRIGVLLAGNALFVGCAYFLLFLAGFTLYGGIGDIGNSIQSAQMFRSCTIRTTVIGYIFLYVLLHIFLAFAMSLFIWMILLLFRNHLFSTVLLLLILTVEGIFSMTLKDQSVVVVLKYENLFRLINSGDVPYAYRNYNLFETPINCFRSLFILAAVVVGISAAAGIWITAKRKPVASASKAEIAILGVIKRLKEAYHRIIAKLSVFGLELYKILIMQKGILFFLLWGYLLVSGMDTNSIFYMGDGILMQEIYREYSGPDDGRLRAYVKENKAVLKQADADYEKAIADYEAGRIDRMELEAAVMWYDTYRSLRICTQNVENQLTYMERVKARTGIDVWFLNSKGYKIILTGDGLYEGAGYGAQEKRALLAVVLLSMLLCMVFSYDRSCGMETLLKAAPRGRTHLFHTRIKAAALLCAVICAVTYGLEIYEVQSIYPLSCLQAPVQSLNFMEDFPLRVSIGTFLVLLELIHFIMLFSIGMMVYAFSAYLKGMQGMIASLAFLAVPAVIKILGAPWAAFLSVTQPMIYVEALQECGFIVSTFVVALELAVGTVCYLLVKKKWCLPHQEGA